MDATRLLTLRYRPDFLAAAASGKKWVTPAFILQFKPDPATEPELALTIRFGLTASKKIGNAIKRNRARRRLRALATDILPIAASANAMYVLIAREAALSRDFAALKKDLIWALTKLGALRDGFAPKP